LGLKKVGWPRKKRRDSVFAQNRKIGASSGMGGDRRELIVIKGAFGKIGN